MAATTTSVIVDDSGIMRLLHPSDLSKTREMLQACSSFRSKVIRFHQTSKQVIDQASEEAERVEAEKMKAIEARHLVALEITSRPQKLADQRLEIERRREELEKLTLEYESLLRVKEEQHLLLGRLTHSSVQT